MTRYYAPKPTYSSWEWIKFIVPRFLIFPLIWDLTRSGVNYLAGKAVGRLVLPAQEIDKMFEKNYFCNYLNQYKSDNLAYENHQIITPDGSSLDTLEIKPTDIIIPPPAQLYIINFAGNGMFYEQTIDEMRSDATRLHASVVSFNYRNVQNSTGQATSKDDLVIDGIAQVQRLLDKGVSPQNIILKGHSLGGGIASLVALHFHQLGQTINIFNSRSFSSLTNVIVGHIRLLKNQTGHTESLGGKILGFFAKPIIKFVLSLLKWEIDADDAFKKIPSQYKDYIVLRTRKEIRDSNVIDDRVIPHYASIHQALKEERRDQKRKLDALIKETSHLEMTSDPLTQAKLSTSLILLKQAREQFKDRKMEILEDNGHNAPISQLKNRSQIGATTFFDNFVKRAQDHHMTSSLDVAQRNQGF